MFVDSTTAIRMIEKEQISSKGKHIGVKLQHFRQLCKDSIVALSYLPTEEQVADILTKSVPISTLKKHRRTLHLDVNAHS